MALSGQLAPSLRATIPGTSRQVRADLLGGVVALRVAFAARFGRPLVVTDGYRSYESQVAIFAARNTTTYLPGRPVSIWNGRKWYRKPGTASAAVPGTSNHGWGQALDLGSGVNSSLTSPEYLWMRANAPRFGWTHPAWARRSASLEPWHWEGVTVAAYVGNVIGTLPAPLAPTPPTPDVPLEVIDMRQAIIDIFEHYTGLSPSEGQVQEFTAFWMLNGSAVTAQQIRDSAAGQVAQAYRDELGRQPESQQVVAAYLAQFHGDIAAIRAALAASPEGLAHH